LPPVILGLSNMKKRDMSKPIEQPVRARVFHRTVQTVKARNAGTDPNEIQALVDDTVREVRAERSAKGKAPYGKRGVSSDTALRLARYFGTTAKEQIERDVHPSMLLPEKMWGRIASCAAVCNRRCRSMASPIIRCGKLFRNSAVAGRIGHVPTSQFLLQPLASHRFQVLLHRAADQFAAAGSTFGGDAFGFPEKRCGKHDNDSSGRGCGGTLSGSSHILFSAIQ
jgi:stalled ribosome alternative rescue factor ArfA